MQLEALHADFYHAAVGTDATDLVEEVHYCAGDGTALQAFAAEAAQKTYGFATIATQGFSVVLPSRTVELRIGVHPPFVQSSLVCLTSVWPFICISLFS